jgi:hexosaminidase
MGNKTYSVLIPVPAQLEELSGKFKVKKLSSYAIAPEFSGVIPELKRVFSTLQIDCKEADAAVFTVKTADLPDGAWEMTISESAITAFAGDLTGASYAVNALAQMLFAATITGNPQAALDTVKISDTPRFPVRSFHLDCARHFQEKELVKKFLRVLSLHRINTFHWHLADSCGWRYASKVAPLLDAKGEMCDGQYTVEEIREITHYAKSLGITVIPEVDVPGHSHYLLEHYPQFACNPSNPGNELCLGNPETMEFLKKIFAELMEIFPNSPIIHIGGDEALTAS